MGSIDFPKGVGLHDRQRAALADLEAIAARDVGRGSAMLARYSSGGLYSAARSLLDASPLRVVVMTGSYIAGAIHPAGETDGPLGAVQVAVAVAAMGGSVRLLTDELCAPVVVAATDAAGIAFDVDVAPVVHCSDPERYARWIESALHHYRDETHVISIERPGQATDGSRRNHYGADVSAFAPPLDIIFKSDTWHRIGIGDGGNELGMGFLPSDLVAEAVPNGTEIHCNTDCDALVIGGTSNWAAAALVAGLACLDPTSLNGLEKVLHPEWSRNVLNAMADRAGAVDGILGQVAESVDGIPWKDYLVPLVEMSNYLIEYWGSCAEI